MKLKVGPAMVDAIGTEAYPTPGTTPMQFPTRYA